jgi:hypothetical protein
MIFLVTGCSYQRRFNPQKVGMPETVFVTESARRYYKPNIVVCKFQAPLYAQSTGETASISLCHELGEYNMDANIVLNHGAIPTVPKELAQFAKEKRYDVIVTGQISTYLDGGISTDSRVEEKIIIYGIVGNRLERIGAATAVETAPPLESTDYIVIQGKGRAALSADTLLKRNSIKFARYIDALFSGDLIED